MLVDLNKITLLFNKVKLKNGYALVKPLIL